MAKYLLGTCAFNEGPKIQRVLKKFNDYASYDVLVVDDGSSDGSLENAVFFGTANGLRVLRNERQQGAGFCVRQILTYAKDHGYPAVLFVAGNDKDSPEDIPKLKQALAEGYDFVQGSRYLPGGSFGNMPAYRYVLTRFVHPFLFSLVSGRKITDSTNGFRAVRVSFLTHPAVDITQPWLNTYELEPYLFYKAVTLGFKVTEVPVKKIYPPRGESYSKMKPGSGWWSILRPLLYLSLGIRK